MADTVGEVYLDSYADVFDALCSPRLAQAMYDAGGVIMDDVLLTLHGDAHRERRHLALRVFRRNFLRHYENDVFPATLHETLAPMLAAGRADLVDLGYRVTMNLTADFAGIDRTAGDAAQTETLLRLVRKFSEGATLVHTTRDPAQVRVEVRAALAEFDALFLQPSIARRMALLSAGEALPQDVLSVLLANEDRIDLPADVLQREVAFYLQAGAHSTANSTVHALDALFHWDRPDGLARARSEPAYLQRCVHESLRLHPASPVAWRRATDDVQLRSGRVLPRGARVVLDLAAANRDERIFGARPEAFDPDRELLDARAYRFGLTFGMGVHNCLGRDLDGGLVALRERVPDAGQIGIVARLVWRLLEAGVRADAASAPVAARDTQRPNFETYPVVFAQ